MNFIQLKYFLAVCEFGSVSAAAEYLHIAQPSLSLAIKELENEFGTLLFHRRHKGMQPTAEGELLLRMGRDIMERTQATEKIMRDVGRHKKTVKLGVPPMIGSLVLPTLYRNFLETNPNIVLDITEGGREELLTMLRQDRLDAAFISHSAPPDEDLDCLPLGSLRVVCGTARSNPLSKRGTLSPSDLAGVPLVMYKDGFFQNSRVRSWFSSHGAEANILVKTNQLSTMLRLISSGTAVGFLFETLTKSTTEIATVPLCPPITEQVSLVSKKQNFPFAGILCLRAFLERERMFE